jgi:hypothetical protein
MMWLTDLNGPAADPSWIKGGLGSVGVQGRRAAATTTRSVSGDPDLWQSYTIAYPAGFRTVSHAGEPRRRPTPG